MADGLWLIGGGPIVVAVLSKDTGGAARLLRLANLSPVGDKVEVKGIVDFGGEQFLQDLVGLLTRSLNPDEAQAFR